MGKAISDQKAQDTIGSPSDKYFKDTVRKNCTALKSITVKCADITNVHTIFGTGLFGVWG